MLVAACSSDRDAGPVVRPTSPPSTTATDSVEDATATSERPVTSSSAPSTTLDATTTTSTAAAATTTTTTTPPGGPGVVRGTAVAGSAGGVEPGPPPFTLTDPFSEAVRLADGTCVGWDGSRGGSTAGLAVGSPVAVLDAATNTQVGTGSITASRWEDVSGGGGQWTCFFDFTADVSAAPAEYLVHVGGLQPWTARQDAANPGVNVASVSTDAAIAAIASCPALPPSTTTVPATASTVATTTLPPATTVPGPPVTGWNAIGQYWSIGVDALCTAGLPVTALARPCRAPTVGSEYITAVVDSNDSTVSYANGAAIPAGTPLTVVVATGRPC